MPSDRRSTPPLFCFLPVLAWVAISPPVLAADSPKVEYPTAVAAFAKVCLVPGVAPQDRESAISADPNWQPDSVVTVNVPAMNISGSIERNYDFSEPLRTRQWSGEIDGKRTRLVLASFDQKRRYPNLCALVLEGPANAMGFGSPLRDAFKAFGIGGKSVNLVHYFEFAGKIGTDKHPVRGEVFSRSQSGQMKNTTHIYLGY